LKCQSIDSSKREGRNSRVNKLIILTVISRLNKHQIKISFPTVLRATLTCPPAQLSIRLLKSQSKTYKENSNFKSLHNIPNTTLQPISSAILTFLAMLQYIIDTECRFLLLSHQFRFKWIQFRGQQIKYLDADRVELI